MQGESYVAWNNTQYIFLRHRESQAGAVLVQRDDPHLYSEIRFRTPPSDSSGVFHKIEHGVLPDAPNLKVADAFDELSQAKGIGAFRRASRSRGLH